MVNVQEVSALLYISSSHLTVTHYLFIAAAVCLLILILCMCYKGCCRNHAKDDPDWDEDEEQSRRIIIIPQRSRSPSIPGMVPVITTHSNGDYEPLEEYGYPAGSGQSTAGVPAYRSTAIQPSAPSFVPRPPSYEESVRPSTSGIQPAPTESPPSIYSTVNEPYCW